MRRIWWFAIGGGTLVLALVVVLGFILFGSGGSGATIGADGCPPPASTASAGNAEIAASAIGSSYHRKIVIHVTDKKSGAPVDGANVSVQGTMNCPHYMPLVQRNLHEAANGTYKGDYDLIMQGQWTLSIVVRSKQGDATTSALPIKVKPGR